jgi:beta-glucosidase
VDEVLDKMTLSEKATVLSLFPDPPRYENVMLAVPRLCIPHLILQDGAAGVAAGMRGVTQLPAPIALAASWDPALAHAYGTVQGQESWGKGIDVAQGPDINIARTPENGLTYEGYGEDPYLVAQTAVADIEGIQHTGVMSDVHHYAANNQQTTRGTIDEKISHRALHEIYLPGFSAAVRDAHVASVMCAYNQVNDNYAASACSTGSRPARRRPSSRIPGMSRSRRALPSRAPSS